MYLLLEIERSKDYRNWSTCELIFYATTIKSLSGCDVRNRYQVGPLLVSLLWLQIVKYLCSKVFCRYFSKFTFNVFPCVMFGIKRWHFICIHDMANVYIENTSHCPPFSRKSSFFRMIYYVEGFPLWTYDHTVRLPPLNDRSFLWKRPPSPFH